MSPTEFILAMTVTGAAIGLVFFFAVPVRRAILRKIEGGAPAADPMLAAEVEQLHGRVAELEERLDFAERLLAQSRETAELPPRGAR